jgi:hypothetical protein
MQRLSRLASVTALASLGVAAACDSATAPAATNVGSQPAAGTGLTSCIPGQSIACAGVGGCAGYQICADDGLRYEPCICEAPPPPPPPPVEAGVDAAAGYQARCSAAEGAPISMPSTDVPAALAGQWWNCGGASELPHVELTADGHYYALTYSGGTFTKNYGPYTSGVYSIDPGSGASFDMELTSTGGAVTGYPLKGVIETTGRMNLGGGWYIRLP